LGQTYKVVPTETITHAPIELTLKVLGRSRGRRVEKMTFGVEQIVVKIVKERMERFGIPTSDLTARFDLCFCAAAAWCRGRFTLEEMMEPAYSDQKILNLRDRIELIADPNRKTFEGAWLEVKFTDGTSERANVDAFLGTPGNRMSDQQLSDIFCSAARPMISEAKSHLIVAATMSLDKVTNIGELMSLLTVDAGH
jgi:2-methylcitrate dehydratase PrpD